jgi:CelD/BcsL family acetyltransferase involved in cellulose biosynthesis
MYPDTNSHPETDPHLCAEWFDLLQRTALPDSAVVDYVPVGPDAAPDLARLPLLRATAKATRLTGFANYYTPLFAPIGSEHLSEAALTRHFRELRQRREIAELQLAPLDPEAPFFSSARLALKNAGWIVDSYFCFSNWYIDLAAAPDTGAPNFAAYWAQRPSKLRHTAQRARRRLEADPSFTLSVTRGEPGLSAAVDAFVSVYSRSWKQPEPWPRFIPELCQLAAARGWLRLGVLELDGQAVASQLWLVSGGCAYIVKLAYDSAYASRTVGTVLSAHMMEHVIDRDHVTRIDYLIGDDAYKRDWTPQRRERRGLVAFNPTTPRGIIAALRHFAGRARRRFIIPPSVCQAKAP